MTTDRTLWEILVPVERVFPHTAIGPVSLAYEKSHHTAWDDKVRAIAGGLTILKTGKGEWVSSSGEIAREPMIPVRVYCTDAQIKQIAEITLKHYDQETVMYYQIAQHVCMARAEDADDLKRGKMHGTKLSDEEAREVRRKLFGVGGDSHWLAEIKKRPPGHWSSADCEYAISRVEALEYEVELHRRKAKDEYWCWQGDGEDYPDSLGCPVLIAAADLRELLAERKKVDEESIPNAGA